MDHRDLNRLTDAWFSSVVRALSRAQESPDLRSGNDEVRRGAELGSAKIERLLGLPGRAAVESLLQTKGIPPQRAKKAAIVAVRGSSDGPGRPPEINEKTLAALILHLIDGKSYSQITQSLFGQCEHICDRCGDVRRGAEGRQNARRGGQRCELCNSIVRPEHKKRKACDLCSDATRHRIDHLKTTLEALGVDERLLDRARLMSLPFHDTDLVWNAAILGEKIEIGPLEAN